jgi:hypothetical protein
MRAVVLAFLLAGCVSQTQLPPRAPTPPPDAVMEPCRQPIKPAVAPVHKPGVDVFTQLRTLARWSSDVQIAREDTVDKLQECAIRLTRAQDWIRANKDGAR